MHQRPRRLARPQMAMTRAQWDHVIEGLAQWCGGTPRRATLMRRELESVLPADVQVVITDAPPSPIEPLSPPEPKPVALPRRFWLGPLR